MSEPNLEEESAALDGYFSDTPLDPKPQYPKLRETFETAVVITNLPKVPSAKVEKLTKVVTRLVSKIGPLATSEDFTGFQMPTDPATGNSLGFAFVEYANAQDATQAVKSLAGYTFDRNHNLNATPYIRAVELGNLQDEEFTTPEPAPFVEKQNTSTWLQDPSQRDQFIIRQAKETCVYWSDGKHDPAVDYDGKREKEAGVAWCEYYVQWSPGGSYLATMVPAKGVILWGGSSFEKIGRFPAPGVEVVSFSPQENFFLTSNNNRNDPDAIKIFSIQTGKLLRAFPLFPKDFFPADMTSQERNQVPPPTFQWSHDDKYVARMGNGIISVYDTATMKLLDKRSLITDDIREFQFSPKANVLAYWAPEKGNTPAHVDIIELPSRKKLRQKNLFNVTKCSMVWHNEGSYLGVKVTRHTKSKKTLFNNLELFRLEDQGIPVEMLDIKDAVMAFAWEPNGSRFAMIHAENPNSTKVNVSFYDMNKSTTTTKNKKTETSITKEVNKSHTLAGKQVNTLFWSPAGQTIIMASLGDSCSGGLEFYDVTNKSLVVKEHYRANQVLWDPSGRTVATVVSQPIGGGHFKFSMDNGYNLWSFQGKQLHQTSYETFYQFQWRPRKSLLSKEEQAKVLKNLKKYEKEFAKADKELSRSRDLETIKFKRALRNEFRERLARLREIRSRQKETRVALNDGYDSEDESNYTKKEVYVETILSTKEEVV
jgi:translation initiation factor 3 subunit B